MDGQTYPVRECQLGVSQATAGRGRVSTQVRPRLVQLTLDVPATTTAAAAETEAAVPGPAALTKQQRYDARMRLMQDSRTKLTATPDEPAQSALTRLERNNMAVERAKLSAHVYHSDEVPPVEEPEGWHKLTDEEVLERGASPEMLLDPKSGFKSALYTASFERPPKLVIAFAGTEDKKDILADLRQGVGREEKQYNEAMDLASAVTARVGARSVEVTGHSLGGGLASAATVVSGAKGYTFNGRPARQYREAGSLRNRAGSYARAGQPD